MCPLVYDYGFIVTPKIGCRMKKRDKISTIYMSYLAHFLIPSLKSKIKNSSYCRKTAD